MHAEGVEVLASEEGRVSSLLHSDGKGPLFMPGLPFGRVAVVIPLVGVVPHTGVVLVQTSKEAGTAWAADWGGHVRLGELQ